MDLCLDKICNEWILLGMMTGLSFSLWQGGTSGLAQALFSMFLPFCIMYTLFRIGGLGAGDVKLLAAVGCYLPIRENLYCLGLSFLAGAVLSLCKMAAERNFGQRIGYFLSYVCEVAKSGNWKLYGEDMEDARNRKKGTIHFALPVLLGVAIYKGGMGL